MTTRKPNEPLLERGCRVAIKRRRRGEDWERFVTACTVDELVGVGKFCRIVDCAVHATMTVRTPPDMIRVIDALSTGSYKAVLSALYEAGEDIREIVLETITAYKDAGGGTELVRRAAGRFTKKSRA